MSQQINKQLIDLRSKRQFFTQFLFKMHRNFSQVFPWLVYYFSEVSSYNKQVLTLDQCKRVDVKHVQWTRVFVPGERLCLLCQLNTTKAPYKETIKEANSRFIGLCFLLFFWAGSRFKLNEQINSFLRLGRSWKTAARFYTMIMCTNLMLR